MRRCNAIDIIFCMAAPGLEFSNSRSLSRLKADSSIREDRPCSVNHFRTLKMKALVYRRSVPRYLLGKALTRLKPHRFFHKVAPLRLEEMPLSPPSPDWIVLRNRFCGICGSDLRLLQGAESFLLEPYASFPAVLGHEILAEVVSGGRGSEWKPGDRVVVEPVLSCEVRGLPPCRYCAEGLYNLCENFTSGKLAPGTVLGYTQGAGGGMAEYTAAHPRQLIRVPDSIPDETAVLADSLASALQPALDHFPEDNHTVVVYGAGILGQHLIRILRTLGFPAKLIAVARHAFQAELARAGGADMVLRSPTRAELGDAVGARLIATTLGGGNLEGGADIFFDCVGSSRSLQEGLLALRGRGSYVMVGTAGRIGSVDLSSLWFRELRMAGSVCYAFGTFKGERVRTYKMAIDLLEKSSYRKEGLVSHVFSLKEYPLAFQAALDKSRNRSMKVVFDLGKGLS